MRILLLLCLALPALGADVLQHIVGGSDASISDYPYVLSLRELGSHLGGASMIASNRAVTVAHFVGSPIGVYSVLGGTSDRTVTNCATCVIRVINLISKHPGYDENGNGYPNDVAVIGFEDVFYNSNLQPIELATPSDGSFAGSSCTIIGWGSSSSIGGPPITLQQASMTVMTNAACADVWGSLSINDGHICLTDSNSAVCDVDSGSPLECSNRLAGVVSWGAANCDPADPSVCSRISYFYSWIIAQ